MDGLIEFCLLAAAAGGSSSVEEQEEEKRKVCLKFNVQNAHCVGR